MQIYLFYLVLTWSKETVEETVEMEIIYNLTMEDSIIQFSND